MPFLRALNWLPVEGAAEGSAAEEHSAPLLHAVGLGRHDSTTGSTLQHASRLGTKRAQQRPSSTAKPAKLRKKGLCA
jgi:hypothetical protein